jgi:uncharacterized membrane protein
VPQSIGRTYYTKIAMKANTTPEPLLEIQRSTTTTYHVSQDEREKLESLPEPVRQNIETIIQLETEDGKNIPAHHRILERVATSFGHPKFLYGQILFFTAWWICSQLANSGILPVDFPRLNLRDEGLDIAALLISTGVLVYQSRQEKIAEERSHLMLQLDLLTEQKIVKLIALVEELRADLPNVRNRVDLEAEEMQQPIDPQALLVALKESLNPSEDEDTPTQSPIDPTAPQSDLPIV